MAFFNLAEEDAVISCVCAQVEQFAEAGKTQVQEALELWSVQRSAAGQGVVSASVPAHGAKLFALS